MESRDIIKKYEELIVQIATPYSTGTGFILPEYNLIVTNEHVVRENAQVVVAGKGFEKQLVSVLYLDVIYDLAFLKIPVGFVGSGDLLASTEEIHQGDGIIAVGHPFGLKYSATQGMISGLSYKEGDIEYIQHDAALNPGNSGGPLIDTNGHIIGVNTFIIQNGNNIGFSLPAKYIKSCFDDYRKGEGVIGVKCVSCQKIIFENTQTVYKYCPICGTKIKMISDIQPYEPYGVSKTIEEILSDCSFDVSLARIGSNNWMICHGSVQINISYHEKSGLLTGDVYLCTIPAGNAEDVYKYLLRQNYILAGLSFSIREQDIILSLLIYDQYLHKETMKKLFLHLMDNADKYDDILISEFQAGYKENGFN
ncbi:MAG: trypsin-like peptidase domain-containing protein [Saprospiraceae bacterium]|nr:trypsin-like peptidase domain-containing protein [Saprospiraceae bacterium]